MKQLSWKVPGFEVGEGFPQLRPDLSGAQLGDLITKLLNLTFTVAAFLMFFWAIWGVFQYIFAGGNKEGLAKARSRITWAIVGFIITLLAFIISQFIQQIFPAQPNLNITDITQPT